MLSIRLRNQLRRSLFLVAVRIRMRGENPANYVARKGVTDICIDGYPRSANSFSVRMFRKANPDASIAHHTHSVANLGYSLKHSIPTVVLIRDPGESIVSSVIAHKNRDIDFEVHRYVDFYEWVSHRLDDVVIADFDTVINDMNSIIGSVNRKFGSSFSQMPDVRDAEAQVKDDIEKRFDRLGQSSMSHIKPIPTKGRNEEKARLRSNVENHPAFEKAQALYRLITSAKI